MQQREKTTPPPFSADGLPAGHDEEETRDEVSRTSGSLPLAGGIPDLSGELPYFLGGRYRLEDLLGEGGMGRVYRAFDEQLGRWVALKLLRPDSSATADRLLFEARSQARVDHPNVCKVYEAGKIDHRPYVAMQYIQGQPLNRAFAHMTLHQKLATMRQVAEGIHAAHLQGLIHRDLKPSNIMVVEDHGRYRAFVLDFGLAREQAAPGVTTTGEVKGTPHYMSPEQVTGEVHTLDHRSDVYGLGATLYEGLTGRPMYSETSGLGVLVKVLNEDPEPLRAFDSTLPPEVDTIVMKCLEKDPEKRYQSSQALAEDLRRYLEGEPLIARPASVFYRLSKRLGKRKVAVLTWALIGLVVLASGVAMATYYNIQNEKRLGDFFRNEVEWIETTLEYAHTSPFHNISPEKERIRERIEQIRQHLIREGRAARGPGNFALGKGYEALEEYAKAKDHLMTAWESGYKESDVAYSLGRVLGVLYEEERRRAASIQDEDERNALLNQSEKNYRDRALEFLRIGGKGQQADSPELPEALILLWERKHEDALQKAEQARQKMPHSYEPMMIRGDIFSAIGDQHRRQGNDDLALAAFDQAEAAYDTASEYGTSDPRVYIGRCALGRPRAQIAIYSTGIRLGPLVEDPVRNCLDAITIDPERAEPHQTLSEIYMRLAEDQLYNAEDPIENYQLAIDASNRAMELQSGDPNTYSNQGFILVLLAEALIYFKQEDPRTTLLEARSAFESALKFNINHAPAHSGLASIYLWIARLDMARGRDPITSLEEALQQANEAIAIRPNFTYALDYLGQTHLLRGQWRRWQLEDPTYDLEEAIKTFEKSAKSNPRYIYAYQGIVEAAHQKILHELDQQQNSEQALQVGWQAIETAFGINPDESGHFLMRGKFATLEGRVAIAAGQDPSAHFAQAESDLDKALELYAIDDGDFLASARLHFWRAKWSLDMGRSARADLDRAWPRVRRALELDQANAESHLLAGKLSLLEARQNRNPERRRRALEDARISLETATELNPLFSKLCAPWFEELDNPSR